MVSGLGFFHVSVDEHRYENWQWKRTTAKSDSPWSCISRKLFTLTWGVLWVFFMDVVSFVSFLFLLLPILLHLLRLHYPHLFCLDNRSPLVICRLKSSLGICNLQVGQTNSKQAGPLEFFRIPQYQIFHRSCFGMICSPSITRNSSTSRNK